MQTQHLYFNCTYTRCPILVFILLHTQELTPRTVHALNHLHSNLYCTSTYKEDFSVHAIQRRHVTETVSTDEELDTGETGRAVHTVETETEINDLGMAARATDTSGTTVSDSTAEGDVVEGTDLEVAKETVPLLGEDSELDTEGRSTDNTEDSIESPSQWSSYPGTGFTTFTHLPQLPDHFRRITTKYTRNRSSPPWPCCVPFYFLRHQSLLPSSITALPDNLFPKPKPSLIETEVEGSTSLKRSSVLGFGEESGCIDVTARARAKTPPGQISSGMMPRIAESSRGRLVASLSSRKPQTTEGKYCEPESPGGDCKLPRLCGSCGEIESRAVEAKGYEVQLQPHKELDRGDVTPTSSVTNETGEIPTLSSLVMPSGSRVPHRLGLRYKTEAHAR